MGVVTIFDSVQPRLEMDDVTVPMKLLDNDTIICCVSLKLNNSTNTAMRAESADLWHRRLGHINSRSLDVLRKVGGNGVDDIGNVKACDVCAIGKSPQLAHPKKATYDIKQPFQLVLADLMRPISPRQWEGSSKSVNSLTSRPSRRRYSSSKPRATPSTLLSCSISLWSFFLVSDWNAFEETGVRNTPLWHSGNTAFRSE